MHTVEQSTLEKSYKPFDIVADKEGNIGFISEVSVETCQPPAHQIRYAVTWLVIVGEQKPFHAWHKHKDLTKHCNMFIKIAEATCHPSGYGSEWVEVLFKNF